MKRDSETIKFIEELRKQIISLRENPPDFEELRKSTAWKNLSSHEQDRLESIARGIRLQKAELGRMKRKMKRKLLTV